MSTVYQSPSQALGCKYEQVRRSLCPLGDSCVLHRVRHVAYVPSLTELLIALQPRIPLAFLKHQNFHVCKAADSSWGREVLFSKSPRHFALGLSRTKVIPFPNLSTPMCPALRDLMPSYTQVSRPRSGSRTRATCPSFSPSLPPLTLLSPFSR